MMVENKCILIVEDDRGLNQGIELSLKNSEYQFLCAYTLAEARELLKGKGADLVLLDINLPDGSGYDLLKEIREQSQIPVIMLTANDMEIDEVMGFRLGADDYITKPFSLMVLRARVERVLQRAVPVKTDIYKKGIYFFGFQEMHFYVDEKEIFLSKTEQKLLHLFVKNEGQILKRELLVDRIWTDGSEYVDENALSVTVNRLRKKLEADVTKSPIQTVYGIGYLWEN